MQAKAPARRNPRALQESVSAGTVIVAPTLNWHRHRYMQIMAALALSALSSVLASCAPLSDVGQPSSRAIAEDIDVARSLGRPPSLSPGELAGEEPPEARPWDSD
jgi:hypothetical protein